MSFIKQSTAMIMTAILTLSSVIVSPAQAGTSVASPKATATISSSCQISAQNVNFGNLVLPLSAQSASSNMTVLCSKNASYTIGLAYGGVYGTGTNGDYWVHEGCPQACTTNYNWYYEYNSAGQIIGEQQIHNVLYSNGTLDLAAEPVSGATYNAQTGTFIVGTTYSYGEMIGVAHGDHVGYSISVPNNPGQVWNTGNYTYAATGTGLNQTLPINATIVPGQSSNTYPTPDYYLDTVTATINF